MPTTGKRMFVIAFILLALISSRCRAQDVEKENIPNEILEAVELGHFAQLYSVDGSLNPFYLRGDFDGDGKADYALRIKSKADNLSGIAIWLSSQRNFVI